MKKQPDAIKGVKHFSDEVPFIEAKLAPYEHLTPPEVPASLSVRIFNMHPDKTYIVRIYEVVESVTLPRRK